ncbi:hypothetical protein SAMN04489729_1682 [Amycolatopsis lurida]|uniref:Lipoprotein n=1 Tax=Amycolatopsis lurida NRRL 2430 TaxID=1460371 RepID=A0A2P2FZL6_AMYLU|nr:hypothetical protein BB31_07465 [Amycolatopsis lurida NRRL 2430]SEC48223.1 hypothetical protein SAMN04489729_1682 [Amycolatopsis lurida]
MRWIVVCLLLAVTGCGAGASKGQVELENFTTLGSAPELAGLGPAELGTAGSQELQRALESAKISNLDEVRATLSFAPPADRRGFAFVEPGCAEDGAELTIEGDTVNVNLTGGENVNCATANYFLAVFTVDRDSIPAAPKLRR